MSMITKKEKKEMKNLRKEQSRFLEIKGKKDRVERAIEKEKYATWEERGLSLDDSSMIEQIVELEMELEKKHDWEKVWDEYREAFFSLIETVAERIKHVYPDEGKELDILLERKNRPFLLMRDEEFIALSLKLNL